MQKMMGTLTVCKGDRRYHLHISDTVDTIWTLENERGEQSKIGVDDLFGLLDMFKNAEQVQNHIFAMD